MPSSPLSSSAPPARGKAERTWKKLEKSRAQDEEAMRWEATRMLGERHEGKWELNQKLKKSGGKRKMGIYMDFLWIRNQVW